MAAGILMLLVGVAILSRLFAHDLAGRVVKRDLFGKPVDSASAPSGTPDNPTSHTQYDRPAGPPAPAGGRPAGGLSWPLAGRGPIIGVPYEGTHTSGQGWQSDNAIDISVPIGTAVLSPASGVVTRVSGSWDGGGSRYSGFGVTITGAGNAWFLKHLEKVDVRPGDRVVAGQVIGASGAGNGVPHLHLGQQNGDPRATFGVR